MININSTHPYFYIIASTEWVGAAFSLSDGVGLRTLPSQPILVGAVSVGTSNEKKGNFQTNWNRCLCVYCKTMWSASKQKWWAWLGSMAWAWPSSVNTTVATWRFPSHFIASSISDGVLYHVKCQYQCWPCRMRIGSVARAWPSSVLVCWLVQCSLVATGQFPSNNWSRYLCKNWSKKYFDQLSIR